MKGNLSARSVLGKYWKKHEKFFEHKRTTKKRSIGLAESTSSQTVKNSNNSGFCGTYKSWISK